MNNLICIWNNLRSTVDCSLFDRFRADVALSFKLQFVCQRSVILEMNCYCFCIDIDRIFSKFQINWKTFMRFRWSKIEDDQNDCFHWMNFLFEIAFNLCTNRFENDTLMENVEIKKYVMCILCFTHMSSDELFADENSSAAGIEFSLWTHQPSERIYEKCMDPILLESTFLTLVYLDGSNSIHYTEYTKNYELFLPFFL